MKHRSKNFLPIVAIAFALPVSLELSEAQTLSLSRKTPSPTPTPTPSGTMIGHVTQLRRSLISEVDTKAKTFAVSGKEKSHVYKVTKNTVISKAGQPATFKDIVVKEEVTGTYVKLADGTFEARTVKLGPPTEQERAAQKTKKTDQKPTPSMSPSATPQPSPPPAPTSPSLSPTASATP